MKTKEQIEQLLKQAKFAAGLSKVCRSDHKADQSSLVVAVVLTWVLDEKIEFEDAIQKIEKEMKL